MPIDIEGWIEVTSHKVHEWDGVDNISPYLISAGAESDYLFGITKVPRAESVAANRGLPEDISKEAKANLDSWKDFEKEESNFSFDELFGFSHISYNEILERDLVNKIGNDYGWCKVFDKMKSIVDGGVEPENVRVVVWALW